MDAGVDEDRTRVWTSATSCFPRFSMSLTDGADDKNLEKGKEQSKCVFYIINTVLPFANVSSLYAT